MRLFKEKIPVRDFVSQMFLSMCEFKLKLPENKSQFSLCWKEEAAYISFCWAMAFQYAFRLEKWQYELLNALLVDQVAKYYEINNILNYEDTYRFLYDRWAYYWLMWHKYLSNKDCPPTELPMALACMLVYSKKYDEYIANEETINCGADFLCMGLYLMTFSTELTKQIKSEFKNVRIIFNKNDSVEHTCHVIKFHEIFNNIEREKH